MKRILSVGVSLWCLVNAGACGSASDEGLMDGGSGRSGGSAGAPGNADDPCGLHSGFKGDELCIPPPAADEGIQLHIGPANYDDPGELAAYLLSPGDENVVCYQTKPSRGGFYYFEQKSRMRFGSHHMLIDVLPADGRTEGPVATCDKLGTIATIPGSQTSSRDFPGRELGPEDAGLGRYLPDGGMAAFQLHYVNVGEEPVLREAWVNLYDKPREEVTATLQDVFLVSDLAMNIPPATTELVTTTFAPKLTEPVRMFELNAHSHAHSERFSTWLTENGKKDLIYESYDWGEPLALTLTDTVQNPAPDAAHRKDGGISGTFFVNPGDTLTWECQVNNTLSTNIRFANEAYTAEMCLLAGSYVSPKPGLFRAACASGKCAKVGRGGL
jgi:hypothetical protein